jgi:hypothetical protein
MSDLSTLEIPRVPYPPEHLEDLKRLGPLLIVSMERDGLPIDSGSIRLGKLDPKLDIAYFYFGWVSECNGVIENLNLALNDLRALPKNFATLGGSPWSRYELLVRLFFHEFYRLREIFNTVMSSCVKRGYLTKSELAIVRDAFHGVIEEAIELRNSVVHGRPTWRGQAHFDLNLASTVHNTGRSLVHAETGENFSIEAALESACIKIVDPLREEGERASLIMNAFVRDTVAITGQI